MDKSTLTAIVITAIIAAFVKEIVTALLSGLKKLFANKAITAKLKNAITARRVMVVLDLALIAYCIWRIVAFARDPSPITRLAIFDIAYWFSLGTIVAARLDRMSERSLDEKVRQLEERKLMNSLEEIRDRVGRLATDLSEELPEKSEKTNTLPKSNDEKSR